MGESLPDTSGLNVTPLCCKYEHFGPISLQEYGYDSLCVLPSPVIETGRRDASNIRQSVLQSRSFHKSAEYDCAFKIHQRIKYLSLELSVEAAAINGNCQRLSLLSY
jgi:hypothetical protein